MKDFKKLLWASLAKNKIAGIWKWAFTNSVLTKYIQKHFQTHIIIQWKLQNNIYFVKLSNPSLSNFLFLHKKQIIEHINEKLQNMNFQKINDIKFI